MHKDSKNSNPAIFSLWKWNMSARDKRCLCHGLLWSRWWNGVTNATTFLLLGLGICSLKIIMKLASIGDMHGLPRVKIVWTRLKWILFGRMKRSTGVNDHNITTKRRVCCQHEYCRDDESNVKRGTFTRFAALFRFAFEASYIEVADNGLPQVQGDVDQT